jgi:glycosyltransferase involved in cell wall biosynthesis
MRVCHVITRLIIGGAQENTLLTCRGLAERGHDVTLIAGPETGPEGSLWEEARSAGCALVVEPDLCRRVHPRRDFAATRALAERFRRFLPSVVHTHSSKAGIIGRLAAHRAGVSIIVHTVHGMSFNRTQRAATRAAYRLLERRAARYTSAFVTVADAMIEQCVTAGIAPPERFTTIRSGIETEHYQPDAAARARRREQWGVGADEVVVGTVARLFENKGYEAILEALPEIARHVPTARFVWIGDGAHRERYEARLRALGLRDRALLVGLIPPTAIPDHVGAFDVLVHASRWEGLPRAVVQGLLMGVPAVAFDNDGTPEVVRTGQTGVLVPFGRTDLLAKAVVELARNADLRRELGAQGRAHCLVEFDRRTMVDRIEALYRDLTVQGGAR